LKGTKAIGTQPSKPWPILANAQERESVFGTKQDIKELQTRLEKRAEQKEAAKSIITLWISTDPAFRAWFKDIIEHNTRRLLKRS
jgi:transcriptional accessory protein Tex/SPT6